MNADIAGAGIPQPRNYLLETRSVDPYYNLALEECLMERIRPGEAALYLWQNQNTVVIGRNQNAWRECKCAQLEADGGKLARRGSGGGAVFHDLGNLNFTFAASTERYDFARQCDVIIEALAPLGIRARLSGRNDMILEDGRKFSGNAFRHTKRCSVQHGTLLISVDMGKLGRYLNPSVAKLRAKGVESVRARVCNLAELDERLTPERMRTLLADGFRRVYGEYEVLDEADVGGAVIGDKRDMYAGWDWLYGLTPEFDVQLGTRFAWGEFELLLKLKNGVVESAHANSDAMDVELPRAVAAAMVGREFGPRIVEGLSELSERESYADMITELAQWLSAEIS